MNWLAHLLLSKKDVEFQLGNFLADPLKGAAWAGASEAIEHGMKMHMAIDQYTDSHAMTRQSKARLGQSGYLKGVVIDVLYDHFLATKWEHYARLSHLDFLGQFYQEAVPAARQFPQHARLHVDRLVASDRLASYHEFSGFVATLARIDMRLSDKMRSRDSCLLYVTAVEQHYDDLSTDFEAFFPELITHFQAHALGSEIDHYLRAA